ncbi:hypothetical protein [Paenibacillus sp. FSL H7-0331]|uniref:hypothetical protein n=1 Tax=Paenibacillus sp. FSL H7-0331 TaxID=1920421 RepID=UPI00096ED4C2|nr:hypothetical protein [Paenibacillus sp. FSL H7-0331]OME97894.1 hypothetical protein BK127_39950 [Paenibacillus sp. FSL H7-0331]
MLKKLLILALCAVIFTLPSAVFAKSNSTVAHQSFGSGCNIWKFFVTASDSYGYVETFGPYADWAEAEAAQTRILNSNWQLSAYIHEEEYCF